MKTALTHELLVYLKGEGYTMLIAEKQSGLDWYVFEPVSWDVATFLDDTINNSYDDHEILLIDEAMKLTYEDLLNHEVKLPH